MIIDFHTHSFPDKIAEKTIKYLSEFGKVPPHREGTLSSLRESMKRCGVDYSVVVPISTSPEQVPSINRVSFAENGNDGIIFAGTVHPDSEDVDGILDGIVSAGLFGIKIHPDYQGACLDDDRYLRILEKAAMRGLIIITHAGLDVGYPDNIHVTPDMVLYVLDKLKGIIEDKLVLAHLGGCDMPDEVIEKLSGKPVYMDTSFVLDRYPEKALEVIKAHGADHILFATDSPWADQADYISRLLAYDLSDEERDLIFFKNALHLLKGQGFLSKDGTA